MAEAWTTDELITDIRDQGALSPDDPAYSDAKIILACNRAQKAVFVPAVRSIRADYYLTHYDYTIVADQATYRVPHRSATNSVRQVFWIDSAERQHELTPKSADDALDFQTAGRPAYYAIKDDSVVLLPAPSSALGTLRIVYERRPSALILASAAQTVTSAVDTGSSPGNWVFSLSTGAAGLDGDSCDIVRAKPPFSLAVRDATVTNVLGAARITPASWDVQPAIGDYICPAEESPIPQLPVELHPMLALCVAAKLLSPIDIEASLRLQTEYEQQMPKVLASLAPRQQGKQQKLKNPTSLLRRGARRSTSGFADWE